MSHFEIVTRYSPELIEQSVEFPSQSALISAMTKNVIQLQDEGVKQALINLGWTPPGKGLMLNDSVALPIMMEIMAVCKKHNDKDINRFTVQVANDECYLLAVYQGNGALYPEIKIVVDTWINTANEVVQKLARDLNTIFGLTDPNC